MSTETVQQNVVSGVGNPFLKKVNTQEQLVIDSLNGKKRICDAHDVFIRIANFYPKEKHRALPTPKATVEIHLMNSRRGTFKEMFQEELRSQKETAFEENQLIEFSEKYKHLLATKGCVFALCHNGLGEYYIASISKTSAGLQIAKMSIETNNTWDSHLYSYAVIKKML